MALTVQDIMNYMNGMQTSPSESSFNEQVEARLREAIPSYPYGDPSQDLVAAASAHLCFSPGARRFRPLVVERLGQLFGVHGASPEAVAVATELIHASSLLHDDVVDTADERRGRPTANRRWGNAAAVLAGDWLLTRAFAALEPLPVALTHTAMSTVARMSASAIIEVEARGKVLPYDRWRRMAEGKTGALFAWAGAAVVRLGGREAAAVAAVERFGLSLGVAFQLGDDLRDFLDIQSGKPRWADLRNGNPSAVLALACEREPSLRASLEAGWSAGVDESVLSGWAGSVLATGAVAEAVDLLRDEVSGALDAIAPWDPQGTVYDLFERCVPPGLSVLEPREGGRVAAGGSR